MTTTMLNLTQIRTHGGTQSRAGLHVETITEYADAMRDGDTFPPVDVYHDGESYWLADGFHRVEAAYKAGLTRLSANVHQGTRRDAVLASVGANARHGLRRSNEDKRRAVQTLLKDDEWGQWSDREIARRAGVSAPFVATIRAQLASSATVNVYSQPQRTGADGRVINTANIGRPATTSRLTLPDISTIGVGDTILTLSGTTGTVRRVFDDHVLADFDKGGELVEEEWSLNHLRIILKGEDAPAVVEPEPVPEPAPAPTPPQGVDDIRVFSVGDWVLTKWGTRGVVRSIDEAEIGIVCYPAREPQYIALEDAAGSLTRQEERLRYAWRRVRLYYDTEGISGVIMGFKRGEPEWLACVRWDDGAEDDVPYYALDLVEGQRAKAACYNPAPNGTVPTPAVPLDHPAHEFAQPAEEDDADNPLDRDLYNLDLTPAGFKAGEALRLEDGQVGVIVPVDDAAGLLTVETPQPAPAVEPFELPETITDMPPLPWKSDGPSYIVSAENPMRIVARVYDSRVGQLIVEAMNERYAAFAGPDNADLKVGEQVYYLSNGDYWRLATVTGLSAKRVQIKLELKAKPSYVELRSLDRRPFGWPLLPGPAPRKGE